MMNAGTKTTTPFHIFKHEVATAAGLAVNNLDLGRLHAAYDMGEPIWMVADEMKLRAKSALPPVKPYRLPRLGTVCVRRVNVHHHG